MTLWICLGLMAVCVVLLLWGVLTGKATHPFFYEDDDD